MDATWHANGHNCTHIAYMTDNQSSYEVWWHFSFVLGFFRICKFSSLVANLMTLTCCISADICLISIIIFALLFLSMKLFGRVTQTVLRKIPRVTLFVRVIHTVLWQIPREMKNSKPRNLRFSWYLPIRSVSIILCSIHKLCAIIFVHPSKNGNT